MSASFDYTNRDDMRALAGWVRSIPPAARVDLAAAVMAGDLMRTHLWLDVLVRLQVWLRKRSLLQAWHNVLHRLPDMANGIVTGFADHIENGRDRYDPRSAAGLCEAEVEMTVEVLSAITEREMTR